MSDVQASSPLIEPKLPIEPVPASKQDPVLVIVLGLLLVGVVCTAYNSLFQQNFVLWDDGTYLVSNRHLKGGLTWENVKWTFEGAHQGNYHPVTWISFLADVTFYGMEPYPLNAKAWGFKLTNLIFHAANTVLVYLLFLWMTGRLWPSLLVGAFFGLHPLHVESVAWATERKDVLSTFFFLLSIAGYLHYAQQKSILGYLGMIVAYVLSLLSKQMYVTLPAALLLLDYWPLRRIGWKIDPLAAEPKPAFAPVSIARAVLEKLPLLALAIGSAYLVYAIQVLDPTVRNIQPAIGMRIENMIYSYAIYIRKMFWPVDLSFFYPYPRDPYTVLQLIVPTLLIAGVTTAALALWRRAPYLLCGWLWYLGMLVPTIGLVQVGWHAYADRYTYVPLIGLFFAIVFGLDDLARRLPSLETVIKGVEVAAVAACAYLAMIQVGHWRDTDTLSRRAIALNKDNFVACVQLGTTGAQDHQWKAAVDWLRKGRDLQPDYLTTRLNLAIVELVLGNVDEARKEYEAAIALRPDNAAAQYQLGMIYLGENEGDKAAERFLASLERAPNQPRTLFSLALAHIKRKDYAAARDVLTQVRDLKRSPVKLKEDAAALTELLDGIEKGDAGSLAKYEKQFDMPATVSGSLHAFNAGMKLGQRALRARTANDATQAAKDLKRSLEAFERSLELWPYNTDALFNLGVLNHKLGKQADAMNYFRRVLEIDPTNEDSKKALDILTNDIVGGVIDATGVELNLGDDLGAEPDREPGVEPEIGPTLLPQ